MPLIKYGDVKELRSQLNGLKEAIHTLESHLHDRSSTEDIEEIEKLLHPNH